MKPTPPTLVLPVMGVPVRFDADAPALRSAVERAFGAWGRLGEERIDPDGAARSPRVRLQSARASRETAPGDEVRIETRSGGRLHYVDPGRVAGRASLGRMEAVIRVAPEGLADPRAVGGAVETLTLFLLTRLDRQPVHAAAVAAGDRGMVVAGPSGTGKSTLAYAALKAGLRVLTDDAVYVQLHPRLRVWGLARPLHLLREAAEWFPELSDRPLASRPGGRIKRRVDLGPWDAGTPPLVERAGLCLLSRGHGGTGVEALSAEEAVEALVSDLDPGFDAFRDTIGPRLRALAAGGAWRVRVGERPHESLPALLDLLDRVGP